MKTFAASPRRKEDGKGFLAASPPLPPANGLARPSGWGRFRGFTLFHVFFRPDSQQPTVVFYILSFPVLSHVDLSIKTQGTSHPRACFRTYTIPSITNRFVLLWRIYFVLLNNPACRMQWRRKNSIWRRRCWRTTTDDFFAREFCDRTSRTANVANRIAKRMRTFVEQWGKREKSREKQKKGQNGMGWNSLAKRINLTFWLSAAFFKTWGESKRNQEKKRYIPSTYKIKPTKNGGSPERWGR